MCHWYEDLQRASLSLILVLSESGDWPRSAALSRLFSRKKSWFHRQIRRPQIFHYHYLHYFLFRVDKGRVILSSAFQYTFLKEKVATDFGWDYVLRDEAVLLMTSHVMVRTFSIITMTLVGKKVPDYSNIGYIF